MTDYEKWFKENETDLSSGFYNGYHWARVYQLLRKAFEAGVERCVEK